MTCQIIEVDFRAKRDFRLSRWFGRPAPVVRVDFRRKCLVRAPKRLPFVPRFAPDDDAWRQEGLYYTRDVNGLRCRVFLDPDTRTWFGSVSGRSSWVGPFWSELAAQIATELAASGI